VNRYTRRTGRPPAPIASDVLHKQLERRLAVICGELGCIAIEARAIWREGGQLLLGSATAGATDADVRILRRHGPPLVVGAS
jgi:hypothetical protein